MSANYTQNYKLCQWEPSDKVIREDFNADNAKLETALTRIEATANAAKIHSDAAYTPENPGFVAGSYLGNASANTAASQKIFLGFPPKAVLVCPSQGGLVLSISGVMYTYSGLVVEGKNTKFLQINEDGFTVHNANLTGEANVRHYLNENQRSYFYIALR